MFAGIDNICAAIRVLVMAERRQEGVLTLKTVMEPEEGKKTGTELQKAVSECVQIKFSSHNFSLLLHH